MSRITGRAHMSPHQGVGRFHLGNGVVHLRNLTVVSRARTLRLRGERGEVVLRALPVLIILGLAIYSFFDVLKTEDLLIRRGPKAMWMVLALIPVLGAALWFLLGRPVTDTEAYPPPRTISLKRQPKQVAPDDDASFLRKLEQEAWLKK